MKKKKMLSSKNSTFANFQNLCIEHQVFLKVVHLLSTVRRLRTDTNQSMIRLTCFPKFIEPCRTQKVVIVLLSLNFVSELQLQKRFPGKTSFGTTIWRHVQTYCTYFPPFLHVRLRVTISEQTHISKKKALATPPKM